MLLFLVALFALSCEKEKTDENTGTDESAEAGAKPETPFDWRGANLYFLLTDRFNNGNPENDLNYERTLPSATLRGFKGVDNKGITQKI